MPTNSLAYGREWREANRERVRRADRKYYLANVEKVRERKRAYKSANPEKSIEADRKCRGLPTPTRPAPALCECCGRPSTRRLNLDHDHKTGLFRGWLCYSCNISIGHLGDDLEGVQRAVNYLKRCI